MNIVLVEDDNDAAAEVDEEGARLAVDGDGKSGVVRGSNAGYDGRGSEKEDGVLGGEVVGDGDAIAYCKGAVLGTSFGGRKCAREGEEREKKRERRRKKNQAEIYKTPS